MNVRSLLRLVCLTASLFATLTACASVSTRAPNPEPVVLSRVQAVPFCPADATQDVPTAPAIPADAVITANASGHDWINQVMSWGASLADRAGDTRAACQKAGADE